MRLKENLGYTFFGLFAGLELVLGGAIFSGSEAFSLITAGLILNNIGLAWALSAIYRALQ